MEGDGIVRADVAEFFSNFEYKKSENFLRTNNRNNYFT